MIISQKTCKLTLLMTIFLLNCNKMKKCKKQLKIKNYNDIISAKGGEKRKDGKE